MSLSLNQSCLVLQNGQRLLETCDLRRPPVSACRVGLRLGNAAILDLSVVVEDSRKLRIGRLAICRVLRSCLVLSRGLLGLVLHVLFFVVFTTAFSWDTFSYSDCASASSVSSLAKLLAKS